VDNAIPILFLHGWPGNWTESYKIIPKLNEAGFDVVAPSLPGFGFSSYTNKPGFKHEQHAEVMHKLMTQRLGYESYVVQGGDWGSFIARTIAIKYPEQVKACHLNMVIQT
jgi:pimeloyl-ACP methyl ester carboxylesterase